MADSAVALPVVPSQANTLERKLNRPASKWGSIVFGIILLAGVLYAGHALLGDLSSTHLVSAKPYVLLGFALLIALGFEFVNGFHDTANAVATVIYTHSLEPHLAVAWSGLWNFVGVMVSSGAVAYSIVSLLPVELILKVGSGAGFAMVFALLLAAIVWNLGTWYFGLPASSSHTLIGSVIGVGLANQFLVGNSGASGVDWGAAGNVFKALLISPLVGFTGAALLLFAFKMLLKDPRLYKAPEGDTPPPIWIRGLLILTCTGVSFAHGSNDGQKGMGLIMLILIGTVPTAYALNHAVGFDQVQQFVTVSQQASQMMDSYLQENGKGTTAGQIQEREALQNYINSKKLGDDTLPAMRALMGDVQNEVAEYKSLATIPASKSQNTRNDMYLVSETMRIMAKNKKPAFNEQQAATLASYRKSLDASTKYIPTWVKVAVAMALGLGTMVGWKRIVVTVGEKIGKEHLTYAQGAAAELTAMCTILAADNFGMPVSTTHVVSSGIAGTMFASGSGLQWPTIRNILLAWTFTLPMAAVLSGSLYYILHSVFAR